MLKAFSLDDDIVDTVFLTQLKREQCTNTPVGSGDWIQTKIYKEPPFSEQ